MQVVIDISEKDYQTLKKKEEFDAMYLNYYEKLIVYGTPLPRGHGDLKDIEVMKNKLCTHEASELFGSTTCAEILDFINDEKPIIEADKGE
jgi:hypothetical protein